KSGFRREPPNTQMKKVSLTLFLFVIFVAFISVGCRSVSTRQTKASQTVSRWLPAGTSLDDATKIFKQHGFAYNPESTASCSPLGDVVFDKTGPIHYWAVLVHMDKGKTTTNITVKVFLTAFLHIKT